MGYRRRIGQLVSLLGVLSGLLAFLAGTAGAAPRQDADLIVFSGSRGGDAYSIYTVRPDGSGRRTLGAADDLAVNVRPSWSRDGRRVAFSGLFALAVARADGARRRELHDRFDDNMGEGASWSPDGRTIVVPGEFNLWLFDVASGKARKLRARGTGTSFSPDGRLIAFIARDRLSVMNADGSRVRALARARSSPRDRVPSPPSWSPDGRRIAFERDGDVVVYDLARRRATLVTRGPRIDLEPVWSPDGRWIAFVRGQPVSARDTEPASRSCGRTAGVRAF